MAHTQDSNIKRDAPKSDGANLRPLVNIAVAGALFFAIFFGLASEAIGQTTENPPTASTIFEQAKKFHDGTGVPQDLAQARILYKRAADLGSNFACINLGYMYFTGQGIPKNYAVSRSWYLTAAKNGNRDAQRMMSVFYKNGLGVSVDIAKADLWSGRAQSGWREINPVAGLQQAAPAVIKPQAAPAEIITPKRRETPAPKIQINETRLSKPQLNAPAVADLALAKPPAAKSPAVNFKVTQPPLPRPAPVKAAETPAKANAAVETNPAVPAAPRKIYDRKTALWLTLLGAAGLAFFGIVTIFSEKYRGIKDRQDRAQFVRHFYKRHQTILKSSYINAGKNKGVIICDPQDPWVNAASNLMIRFAQKQEISTGRRMRLTSDVIHALGKNPDSAQALLMPLMPAVEDVILADIAGAGAISHAQPSPSDIIRAMLARPAKQNNPA